jgi:hypothetical protein
MTAYGLGQLFGFGLLLLLVVKAVQELSQKRRK